MAYRRVEINPQPNEFTRNASTNENHTYLQILEANNLRIFSYSNKLIIVNSIDHAIMMFQIRDGLSISSEESVSYIDFELNTPIKLLPNPVLVNPKIISKSNIEYIVYKYLKRQNKIFSKSNIAYLKDIAVRYNISIYFSKILTSVYKKDCDIGRVCNVLRDIAFYLKNHAPLYNTLCGSDFGEKKKILYEYIPSKVCSQVGIETITPSGLDKFITEFFKCFYND